MLCCQDIAQVMNKINEAVTSGECEKPTCITQHPGFNPVCIIDGSCRLLGISISNNVKNHLMGLKTNYTGTKHTDNWPEESSAKKLG